MDMVELMSCSMVDCWMDIPMGWSSMMGMAEWMSCSGMDELTKMMGMGGSTRTMGMDGLMSCLGTDGSTKTMDRVAVPKSLGMVVVPMSLDMVAEPRSMIPEKGVSTTLGNQKEMVRRWSKLERSSEEGRRRRRWQLGRRMWIAS